MSMSITPVELVKIVEQTDASPRKSAAPLKTSSRLNIRRSNQLLSARSRVPTLSRTSLPSEKSDATSIPVEVSANEDIVPSAGKSDESIQTETSTQPMTVLNKLRNRPRLQVHATESRRSPSGAAIYSNVNRKVNPLISRRKNIDSTSTTITGKLISFVVVPQYMYNSYGQNIHSGWLVLVLHSTWLRFTWTGICMRKKLTGLNCNDKWDAISNPWLPFPSLIQIPKHVECMEQRRK